MKRKNWKYIGLLAGAVALAISLYIGREAISRLEAETTYAAVAKSVWSSHTLTLKPHQTQIQMKLMQIPRSLRKTGFHQASSL